ncbi:MULTISPECIES: molybdopterin-binding oxidoreductase [unclassified Agarivorans]|uniref:molybdopterin-binding oxidoreductase n=1 Tax=unclassified Agarivorans TaxID=2636026 RepID=UPI003D7C8AD5
MRYLMALSMLLYSVMVSADLAKPNGPPVLTLAGAITQGNNQGAADFDLKMLQDLPQYSIVTRNPWVESRHHYRGPRVADILELVGAESTRLIMVALNDYEVEIDFSDISQFDPILAWSDNEHLMRVREKGPLWLMLPIDQHPELLQMPYNDFMIWQLRKIIVK